ncbi:MAG: hypothetical protein JSS04_02355 [Proteobacteria bacterium]|nr:hypothetical protein [Pseudomonadota bacterium]
MTAFNGLGLHLGNLSRLSGAPHARGAISSLVSSWPVAELPYVRHWTFAGAASSFGAPSASHMQNKPLAERSILLVEDDIILSTDLAFAVTEAGCKAIVPVTSNAAALSAMVHYLFDAAILDVNVQDEWVFPVANALDAVGIPFLFLTAYSHDSIPAQHRGRPFIRKPHHPDGLLDALVRLIEGSGRNPAANDETTRPKAG